jgi:neutral amino acid transport system permease protein
LKIVPAIESETHSVRRLAARLLVVLLGVLTAVAGAGALPAQAAGETVQGTLRNNTTPLPGIKLTVTGSGGFSGTATSNAQGRWVVPVPAPGPYTVTLDTTTLPSGVSLRFPDRNPLKTTVGGNQTRALIFAMGRDTRVVQSTGDQAINRIAQGLRFGLLIALAAVGLSLIFGTTGLTNFAHGELVTFGAIMAYAFNTAMGIPLLLAAVLTVIVSGAAGWFNDAGLWAPLRRRGTGLIPMMIVSIGLSILLRYIFLYFFGGTTKSYAGAEGAKGIGPGPITLTALDYLSMAISVVVLLAFAFFLLRTRTGKATRAVSDNPALASASGIDVERVIRIVWMAGAALAGLAGVLLGIAQQVTFQMGFQILLLIFAAVTLGGLGTAFGALVGSLVVGLITEVSTLFIPAELKYVGALVILIVILLVRPQGILGRAQRIG